MKSLQGFRYRVLVPFWSFLSQPIWGGSKTFTLNPTAFWRQYRRELLERCWELDSVEFLERCWTQH